MNLSFATKNVLVVDDDPLLVLVLTQFLEDAGYWVVSAENGRKGLEQFQTAHFDVAIVDRAMPEMGGEEMALEVRKREPGFPVILITGCREAIAHPERYEAILIKPFRSDALVSCVARLLGLGQTGDAGQTGGPGRTGDGSPFVRPASPMRPGPPVRPGPSISMKAAIQ